MPEALAGAGRRAARLPPHSNAVACKTAGLEPALIDNSIHQLTSFENDDNRKVRIKVTGPAALVVANVRKTQERQSQTHRIQPKDRLDTFRLLSAVDSAKVSQDLLSLTNDPT